MAATAESCTGGLIAGLLTEIPGSSNMLERGFVVYSNAAKQELLGVPAETLVNHGAVSEQTAVAMAEGALRASRAEVAVSVTGIAGPDGGTRGKARRPCPFRLRPAGQADCRPRGAVWRHRPQGGAARLGHGRARSARGGAEPLSALVLVGRSRREFTQFGHEKPDGPCRALLAGHDGSPAGRFGSLPKVHFPATQRGSFPAVTPTLGGRA